MWDQAPTRAPCRHGWGLVALPQGTAWLTQAIKQAGRQAPPGRVSCCRCCVADGAAVAGVRCIARACGASNAAASPSTAYWLLPAGQACKGLPDGGVTDREVG